MDIKVVEIDGERFYRGPDKKLMPSASSVLDVLFPMNKNFIPEDALAMGTLCHKEISKALVGELVHHIPYAEHEDPKVARRVAAALEWLVKSRLEILAVESPTMFLGVGMTPDLLGGQSSAIVDANGKPVTTAHYHVVDWKFAESVTERYMYQAEFYMRAEGAEVATIVRVDREAKVYPVKVTKDDERWEKIKSAVNVRHHLNRNIKFFA